MATMNEDSDDCFRHDLSQVHRKLMTSLSHVTDVLVSEIAESGARKEKQQALQSAAVDLAVAIEDIRTLKKIREKVLSNDSTGILSFSGFLKELDLEIDRAKKMKNSLGLLLLEFDLRDSYLNKSMGSDAVRYIEETAQMLKTICRKSDLLGRSSNTGFFMGLVGADLEESSAVAEKIHKILKDHPLHKPCRIAHGIGVAVWPLHAEEREDLVFGVLQSARTALQRGGTATCLQQMRKQ